jgi:hypothetical protein
MLKEGGYSRCTFLTLQLFDRSVEIMNTFFCSFKNFSFNCCNTYESSIANGPGAKVSLSG